MQLEKYIEESYHNNKQLFAEACNVTRPTVWRWITLGHYISEGHRIDHNGAYHPLPNMPKGDVVSLVDYINRYYAGSKQNFARAQGVLSQHVTYWVKSGHFIRNGKRVDSRGYEHELKKIKRK